MGLDPLQIIYILAHMRTRTDILTDSPLKQSNYVQSLLFGIMHIMIVISLLIY